MITVGGMEQLAVRTLKGVVEDEVKKENYVKLYYELESDREETYMEDSCLKSRTKLEQV